MARRERSDNTLVAGAVVFCLIVGSLMIVGLGELLRLLGRNVW